MEQTLEKLIDEVIVNGKVFKLAKNDEHFGVDINYCSEYISSLDSILRGECDNYNDDRNALITKTNVKTKETCNNFSKIILLKLF